MTADESLGYQNVLQLWEGSYLSRTKQSFYDWGVIANILKQCDFGELQDNETLAPMDGQMSLMSITKQR